MGGARGRYGREESYLQCFDGVTFGKVFSWKTYEKKER